ncbi:hypothetical protein DXT98_01355 [Agrobacterium sp. ICMP 7243]|nr:hypothetical protein DXT98_01355 [Agrobacterium sp. ICMP 7243]
MKWGDQKRDFDTILAVWPVYRPRYKWWCMQELVDNSPESPTWRERRIPTADNTVKMDVYRNRADAVAAAIALNPALLSALESRKMDPFIKRSLRLKVSKALQAKERLQDEELLMLTEGLRRTAQLPRPEISDLMLDPSSEEFRQQLWEQLVQMPYLSVASVENSARHDKILYKVGEKSWSKPFYATEKLAIIAERAKIAEAYGLSSGDHWGRSKAQIREILLPRANQLLKLASVQRMLAEALAKGQRVLVSNGIVFWYEEDGSIGWQVKETTSTNESDGATLWTEGTILSKNHGRLVILPYIKDDGEQVKGHTKNGPNDGRAKPRHPDQYVNIPFKQLTGDLMIGLLGELPYE